MSEAIKQSSNQAIRQIRDVIPIVIGSLAPSLLPTLCLVACLPLCLFACFSSATDREGDSTSKDSMGLTVAPMESLQGSRNEGFASVTSARRFSFPADHGSHPEYRIEWWYYTGNLDTDSGRHFGYQLTFFRVSLTTEMASRESKWATNQMYMAHFTVTDVKSGRFYAFERFSRSALQLAGARSEPFSVWLENWSATHRKVADSEPGVALNSVRVKATEDNISIDLSLQNGKAVVLQGEDGLSRKGTLPGQASYYYSLTRMPTHGTIQIGEKTHHVRGLSWFDREWSSSFLSADQVGWDWFALQLSDKREVMFYQLRRRDGRADPFSGGTFVYADGSTRRLTLENVKIDILNHWSSPVDGVRYPSQWSIHIPSEQLMLTVNPYFAAQELRLSARYWEGAVAVKGTSLGKPINGYGYVELTGR